MPRWLLALLVLATGALAYLAFAAHDQAGGESSLAHAPAAPEPPAASATEGRRDVAGRAQRTGRGTTAVTGFGGTLFAQVDELGLKLPHPEPVLVAFHEASRPDALELTPVGRLGANDNATDYTPPDDAGGPAYRVLPSRGGARPATSAVDVVVPAGSSASAPVTGTVVAVREYLLYGSLRDWRVVIQPDARPDLHVVLIHLHEPAVAPGERVEAGVTPLAVIRQLALPSDVDHVVGERKPHVQLAVRPATAPKPHDPNEPAMDAEERLEEVTGARRGTS